MSKLSRWLLLAPLVVAASVTGAGVASARAGETCGAASGPALLIDVRGFKQAKGELRVQVYGSDPAQFVKGGKRLVRIDEPVRTDPMRVCVPLPAAGHYAVAVRHDLNGDGKSSLSDGGGFSRNPSISLGDAISRRMPRYQDVAVSVGGSPLKVDIVMQYVRGLSIGPIKTAER
jgi:uncharacterized protein (DUF2141 family)